MVSINKGQKRRTSSHALFWTLLKETPGYNPRYKEVIKEGVVHRYSGGRTQSLSEMYSKYPTEYCQMIEAMKRQHKGQYQERYEHSLNQSRRRVIAVICAYIDKLGYTFPTDMDKIHYVISIACRAANCSNFNAIPESRLSAIYNLYLKRNDVKIEGNPELDFPIGSN